MDYRFSQRLRLSFYKICLDFQKNKAVELQKRSKSDKSTSACTPSAQKKWSQFFCKTNSPWKDFRIIPYQRKLDTKLREFQFSIIHRILTENYNLHKMSLDPRV